MQSIKLESLSNTFKKRSYEGNVFSHRFRDITVRRCRYYDPHSELQVAKG